jgi:hypothetical protein
MVSAIIFTIFAVRFIFSAQRGVLLRLTGGEGGTRG